MKFFDKNIFIFLFMLILVTLTAEGFIRDCKKFDKNVQVTRLL